MPRDALDFDIFDAQLRASPVDYQRRFREGDPIHHSSQGFWVVTRHADVLAMLRDARTTTDRRDLFREKLAPGCPYLVHVENNLFYRSADDHTRLRSPLTRSFTGRAIAALRPRIEAKARELAGGLDPDGFDLVGDFAKPLPLTVIADLLGVPHSELGNLQQWSLGQLLVLEPGAPPAAFVAADEATAAMKSMLQELLALRRRAPGPDLLSQVATSGAPLTDDELLHNAIFLLAAGHDTTTALITGAVDLLLAHPDQLSRVRDDDESVANAVDELARLISPAQMIGRFTTDEIDLAGHRIAAGSPILLGIAAANRDPAAFEDPERLDIGRASARHHLGFGFGPHVCLGAPLAREQARLALPILLRRFPHLAEVARPDRRDSSILVSYNGYRLRGA